MTVPEGSESNRVILPASAQIRRGDTEINIPPAKGHAVTRDHRSSLQQISTCASASAPSRNMPAGVRILERNYQVRWRPDNPSLGGYIPFVSADTQPTNPGYGGQLLPAGESRRVRIRATLPQCVVDPVNSTSGNFHNYTPRAAGVTRNRWPRPSGQPQSGTSVDENERNLTVSVPMQHSLVAPQRGGRWQVSQR